MSWFIIFQLKGKTNGFKIATVPYDDPVPNAMNANSTRGLGERNAYICNKRYLFFK
ncbi:hypothetical protein Q4574_14190 [Aliiglaciecola sp. 3_MG-2023]|uniref:hypothetical protein n=1 Tax=Aliiglaciecola sp. 3_MG-2023 TaxID=3062644 RepID=UPI0026E29808|nr:hypothetical protein [Aliiglaciecola sp. 3_MG-2023]MDO6694441.1 hypothetical protein [Aliiglaciecola sp. 3_MG-2023]